jgi:hypothetical protein
MCPEQVGIVKLHARLTATHALNGLAVSVWNGASKARIGITLAGQKGRRSCRPERFRDTAQLPKVTPTSTTLPSGTSVLGVPHRTRALNSRFLHRGEDRGALAATLGAAIVIFALPPPLFRS